MNLDSDRIDRITANATARAKIIQAEIDQARRLLNTCPSNVNGSIVARLQSLDAEMAYLMKIPGVAQAFFDEGAA